MDSIFNPFPKWEPPMFLQNWTTAETNFDSKATKNVKVIFRRKDKDNCWKVTEEECTYAKKSNYPKDLRNFTISVCSLFLLHLNKLIISFKDN
jgi:hypothetical protein